MTQLGHRALPLIFGLSLLGSAAARGDDWPGWRGLEREGCAASSDGPVEWAPDRNVVWKTPISGKGHSSPIVVGDRVVVTTAVPSRSGRLLKRRAAHAAHALVLVLPLLAAPFVLRSCRVPAGTKQRLATPLLLCFLLGVLLWLWHAAFARFGVRELNHDEQMELWLATGQLLALCLMLATLALPARRKLRLLLAAASVGLAALVVFGRPAPAYFPVFGPLRYAPQLKTTAAIPLGIALAIAAATLRPRRSVAEAEPRRSTPIWLVLALAGAAAAGLAGLAFARLWPQTALLAAAIAWLPVELLGLRRERLRLPWWFALGAVAVGTLGFAERNLLVPVKEHVRAIVCLDRTTGTTLWVREGLRGPQPSVDRRNSPATPTPVSDGQRIIAWFGTPGCMCTDLEGSMLWKRTDVPFEGVHGVAASPILADGLLIIVGAQATAPYIRALDPATGDPAWTFRLRPWPGVEGQHRTPTVKALDGRSILLVWGWDGPHKEELLRAIDTRTGKELWQHPVRTWGEAVASIVSDGDTLFLPSSRQIHALSLARLAAGEAPVLWTADMKTKGPDVASPVLVGGRLFTVSRHRHAACLDARTGEVLWRERLKGKGCLAPTVAIGDKVYFSDVAGITTVVAAEAPFRKLAENTLGEPIFAAPAPAGGRLFVRTTAHVWCIGK